MLSYLTDVVFSEWGVTFNGSVVVQETPVKLANWVYYSYELNAIG